MSMERSYKEPNMFVCTLAVDKCCRYCNKVKYFCTYYCRIVHSIWNSIIKVIYCKNTVAEFTL